VNDDILRTRRRISVGTVSPPGYLHVAALREVVESVGAALSDLDFDMVLAGTPDVPLILFGWHLLDAHTALPPGTILYNLEQVSDDADWLKPWHLDLAHRYTVWDYSKQNVERWAAKGIKATLVPIGYHPILSRIEPATVQDIDVLFYGSLNQRRADVLNALEAAGVKVKHAFGLYGAARDSLIARSKLVLNLHFYTAQVFEIVRCSYLFANRIPVVSEGPAAPGYEHAATWASYDMLVDACKTLLRDDTAREAQAQRGYEAIRAQSLVTILHEVLAL